MVIARLSPQQIILPFTQFMQICLTQTINRSQNQNQILNFFRDKSPNFYQILKDYQFRFDNKLKAQLQRINEYLTQDQQLLIKFLYCNYNSRKPALIYGLEATGKYQLIKIFCKLKNISENQIVHIKLNQHTTCSDLFGRLYPNLDTNSNDKFYMKEGPITHGIKNGKLIIIQGLNQVDGNVSQSLNAILEVGKIDNFLQMMNLFNSLTIQ